MNFIHRHQPAYAWANQINRLFDQNFLDTAIPGGSREVIHESDSSWTLRLDLPGFSKANVKLTLSDRTLKVVAEPEPDQPFGTRIQKVWNLGKDIDSAAISARLENGVLELTLPKHPPITPETTTIQIQ